MVESKLEGVPFYIVDVFAEHKYSGNQLAVVISGETLTSDEMQRIAKAKGGLCLSSEYIDAKTHLTWQCKEGHVWNAKPSNIKTGHWCPQCAENKK